MTIDINSNKEKLDLDEIQDMLSKVYWSPGITKNEILKGISNSAIAVGAYLDSGQQVGFLRVISDKVRFAYILDVVVNEECRGQGIGQKMVKFALSHPELRDVYQWLLITRDAHGLYDKCGFVSLQNPEKWMSIINPRPDRTDYSG